MIETCAWCGASLAGARERPGRLRCAACSAWTTHPWPSEAELDAAYGAWYRPQSGRFGRFGDAMLRRSRGAQAHRIHAVAPVGLIVDVGSGDGTLVRALEALGRAAVGLERGDEEIANRDAAAAGFVFWHSLEHLREPRSTLRAAATRLVHDGVVFIAVPNAASLQARVFGDKWLALDLPRHLVHLPAHALISGLETDGWRVTRVSHWRGGQIVFGWLHGLVGLLGLDLYQSIRTDDARSHAVTRGRRLCAVALAVVLTPLALVAGTLEVALRRGGSVYVEARRA